tara:strand:- start:34491 stop:35192 length:702 start_codon:yes stop_codon:yes gene_type:complete
MVDVDKAIVARLKKEGRTFEILVDCDKALDFKAGKEIPIEDVVATDDIFSDVKKGEKASSAEVENLFNTSDVLEVAKVIIKDGEVQLTQEHKENMREVVRKQLVELIHRNAVDAQTGLPHPVQRIENAMREANIKVREYESAEKQLDQVLNELKPIIPIKVEVMDITLQIPAKFAGNCMNVLKKYKLSKNEWQSDGSLMAVVEIPAGIQEEFFDEVNKLTHGEVESKIDRRNV